MLIIMTSIILILILIGGFFSISKKQIWMKDSSMTFECGFSSYFFSRFSFSIHYFIIGLIFLFLDLEMCFLFPFFNQDFSTFNLIFYSLLIIIVMLLGLLAEWAYSKLEWKF